MVRRILLSLLAAAIVLIVDAVPAAATWEEHCKIYGPHCYSVYKWYGTEMEPKNLYDGAAASFNVHEAWTEGVSMQDEMWVGCGYGSKEWVETGVIMGQQDESTLYRFVAAKVKGQYYEFDDWQVPQPKNVNLNFWIQRNFGVAGAFQVFWTATPGGYQWMPAKEYAGLRCTYPQDVEVGLEASTYSAPLNYATSTLGLYRNGGMYTAGPPWNAECLDEGLGLWARWGQGEYGSNGNPTRAATTAPPKRRTKRWAGTGTIVSQEGETTVRRGKYKLSAPVPYSTPKAEPMPTGTTFVEVKGATRVARYIGEGEPNYDYMKLGIR